MGGQLVQLRGSTLSSLNSYLSEMSSSDSETKLGALLYCESEFAQLNSVCDEIRKELMSRVHEILPVTDDLLDRSSNSQTGGSSRIFNEYEVEYTRSNIEPPVMDVGVTFVRSPAKLGICDPVSQLTSSDGGGHVSEGESLTLVSDWLDLGDRAFTAKYARKYLREATRSAEHLEALRRLTSLSEDEASGVLFEGEVLSALLAPRLAMGLLSPRLLARAEQSLREGFPSTTARPRTSLLSSLASSLRPLTADRLALEGIRRDWHRRLARLSLTQPLPRSLWRVSHNCWRGYVVREAVMEPAKVPAAVAPEELPVMVLVHGFGGSLEQFTGLADRLSGAAHRDEGAEAAGMKSPVFRVLALDSLGFGQSEKPPLSYNQYLWRDQVVEFVRRNVRPGTPVILAGNSIGGYTAGSAAAVLFGEGLCRGLVLFNSAGKILQNVGLTESPLDSLFPEYKGPRPAILELVGRTVFSLLQPVIPAVSAWLYPVRPEVGRAELAPRIFRDSCDPGASGVIAAGGKLPPPQPFNDLLRQFPGPVLVANGVLDPLNNATARAEAFYAIRPGVETALLQLGHCPMEEGPAEVAEAIYDWLDRNSVLERHSECKSVVSSPNP